jgi:hypothetical protein
MAIATTIPGRRSGLRPTASASPPVKAAKRHPARISLADLRQTVRHFLTALLLITHMQRGETMTWPCIAPDNWTDVDQRAENGLSNPAPPRTSTPRNPLQRPAPLLTRSVQHTAGPMTTLPPTNLEDRPPAASKPDQHFGSSSAHHQAFSRFRDLASWQIDVSRECCTFVLDLVNGPSCCAIIHASSHLFATVSTSIVASRDRRSISSQLAPTLLQP